jgi:hypothetical protein
MAEKSGKTTGIRSNTVRARGESPVCAILISGLKKGKINFFAASFGELNPADFASFLK